MATYQVPIRYQGHYVYGGSDDTSLGAFALLGVIAAFLLLFLLGATIYTRSRPTSDSTMSNTQTTMPAGVYQGAEIRLQ